MAASMKRLSSGLVLRVTDVAEALAVPKKRRTSTRLHGATSQKTVVLLQSVLVFLPTLCFFLSLVLASLLSFFLHSFQSVPLCLLSLFPFIFYAVTQATFLDCDLEL
jgi:hypothetical protein